MTDRLRLVTWNINSLRLRMALLGRVVEETRADVVCLQETKVDDANFPMEAVRALGFEHVLYRGDKGYNGVAILSKRPIEPAGHRFWGGVEDARHISARLADGMVVHNFYVPAGGGIPDPATGRRPIVAAGWIISGPMAGWRRVCAAPAC